jgi:AcrR family transcriptional regulator
MTMDARAAKSREASKKETRVALIRAGMRAFEEQGVDAPSLDSICERAGFTRGAFYVHFKDRDDFLLAVVDRVIREFVESVISTGGRGDDMVQTIDRFLAAAEAGKLPLAGHHRIVSQLMSRGAQRADTMRGRFREMMEGAVTLLARGIEAGQRAGQVRPDIVPKELATVLVSLALGLATLMNSGFEPDYAGLRRTARIMLQVNPDG